MTYQLSSTTSIIRTADGATIPDDPGNSDYQAYLAWIAGGNVPTPVAALTAAQQQATYSAAGQALLDSTAQAWNYNDMATAATYLQSTIAQFKSEATTLCAWRDNFWYQAGLLEAQIIAGTATLPATTADFLALMPAAPVRPT